MRRLCPACTARRNTLVDPECVICEGTGILPLGEAALSIYSPDVVAEAVHLALEAAAREADQQLTLSDDRDAPLRHAVVLLHDAGIIGRQEHTAPPVPPAPRPKRIRPRKRDTAGQYVIEVTPSELAQQAVQTELLPLDISLCGAPLYTYTEHERPNARGLPVLSANGHPSHLARLADPTEAGSDTRAECRMRRADHRHAVALVEAQPEAARRRNRKLARQQIAAAA